MTQVRTTVVAHNTPSAIKLHAIVVPRRLQAVFAGEAHSVRTLKTGTERNSNVCAVGATFENVWPAVVKRSEPLGAERIRRKSVPFLLPSG